MNKLYKPDVDALRGLAVIAVLFYHAKFKFQSFELFSGGYLGVDIFFVLTGFLITRMLLNEHKITNDINIRSFYLRRIRRLVPVLLVVIMIATFLSYFFLDPVLIKNFSQSVFFSLAFLPNIYFHYFGNFYGQNINLYKPLLHLWSLGIEEQFYIFYPLFLLITFKYFKKYFLFLLCIGFSFSLLFAEYASQSHKQFSFYMLPSRAWEITAGALVAFVLFKKKINVELSTKAQNIVYLICISAIFFCLFRFNIYSVKHPSILTFVPVLATSIIIILGESQKKCFLFYFFSNKVLIHFGKISYSLYLFHFLIFSFFRNSHLEETFTVKIILIISSIIIAQISYKYIEQIYRNKLFPIKKLFKQAFFLIIIIISLNSYFLLNKNLLDQDYVINGVNITEQYDTKKIILKTNKYNYKSFPKNNKINVLVIGNCHADDIFLAMNLNKDKFKNYNFILYPRIDIYNFEKIISNKNILYSEADIIVAATKWNNSVPDTESLENLNNKLKKDTKKLVVFSNVPEFEYTKSKYKLREIKLTNYKRKILSAGTTLISLDEIHSLKKKYYQDYINNKKVMETNKKLEMIVHKNKIKFIDSAKLFCDDREKMCDFRLEDSKDELFRDYGRYSYQGIIYVGNLLFKKNFLAD